MTNLMLVFVCIAIFQGIVLGSIILKTPVFKSKANKNLAIGVFLVSYSLLNFVLDDLKEPFESFPLLKLIDKFDIGLFFLVFIFLFIVYQVNHPLKNSNKRFFLFTPILIDLIDDFVIDFLSANNQLWFFETVFSLFQYILVIGFIPFILIYAYKVIKFSINENEQKWLKKLWNLVVAFYSSFIILIFLALIIDETKHEFIIFISVTLLCFLIHWTTYNGIYKFKLAKDQNAIKAILNKKSIPVSNIIENNTTAGHKFEVQGIEKQKAITEENLYFKNLEKLCNIEHIYRDSTLDRDKIADKLGISSGYLSQIVNSSTGENFSTYINRYRVNAVKKLILDPEFDNYSLLAIGLECGFSSKTTFYNTFKKLTGITPNAFKKANK